MPLANELNEIVGAKELHDWFGYWPSFHDAEIVSLHLNRRSPSKMLIHTWNTTKEVDAGGFYVMNNHVVVEFVLEDIVDLDFGDFSSQNVISSLHVEKKGAGFTLTLGPCYGLAGTIEATKVTIKLCPGMPSDSLESC
jgi:Immunity protein 50